MRMGFSVFFIISMGMIVSQANAKTEGDMLLEELRKIKTALANTLNETEKLERRLQRYEHNCSCAPCLPKAGTDYCDCRNLEAKKDCLAFVEAGIAVDGLYKIEGPMFTCNHVYCDQTTDGGGWTVIQRRKDGSENFFRNWADYKNGFGNVEGELWLGNDKIHHLTDNLPRKSSLLINMKKHETKEFIWAKYSSFSIDDESKKYKLHVGGFSGNATDRLVGHNGKKFTTKDQDNDDWGDNCAVRYKGAWWYSACYTSNLNGVYIPEAPSCVEIAWPCNTRLVYTEMKIRRNA